MIRRPPRSTRTDTLFPYTTLFRSAQVRFSWIMLGREPRSTEELLMVYAGIMAHGTSLTAAECARMIPQLSATRSEEHTSELQSLMRISYAVFCLKKKNEELKHTTIYSRLEHTQHTAKPLAQQN